MSECVDLTFSDDEASPPPRGTAARNAVGALHQPEPSPKRHKPCIELLDSPPPRSLQPRPQPAALWDPLAQPQPLTSLPQPPSSLQAQPPSSPQAQPPVKAPLDSPAPSPPSGTPSQGPPSRSGQGWLQYLHKQANIDIGAAEGPAHPADHASAPGALHAHAPAHHTNAAAPPQRPTAAQDAEDVPQQGPASPVPEWLMQAGSSQPSEGVAGWVSTGAAGQAPKLRTDWLLSDDDEDVGAGAAPAAAVPQLGFKALQGTSQPLLSQMPTAGSGGAGSAQVGEQGLVSSQQAADNEGLGSQSLTGTRGLTASQGLTGTQGLTASQALTGAGEAATKPMTKKEAQEAQRRLKAAERDRKAAEKEQQKQERSRLQQQKKEERELKKQAAQAEKQSNKQRKEQDRQARGKLALDEIVVLLDCHAVSTSTLFRKHIMDRLDEQPGSKEPRLKHAIEELPLSPYRCIAWKRVLPAWALLQQQMQQQPGSSQQLPGSSQQQGGVQDSQAALGSQGMSQPMSQDPFMASQPAGAAPPPASGPVEHPVPYVLVVFDQPGDFIDAVLRDGLESLVHTAAALHADCTLGVLTVGLDKALTQRERKDTGQDGCLFSRHRVEQQWVEVSLACPAVAFRHVDNDFEAADYVRDLTKALAEQPYKPRTDMLEALYGANTNSHKEMRGRMDDALSGLPPDFPAAERAQIAHLAKAIHGAKALALGHSQVVSLVQKFRSLSSLMLLMDDSNGSAEPFLSQLADERLPDKQRRFGPAAARKLHMFLTADDSNLVLES